MKVYNVPQYAYEDRFIVAREYDGEFWFWGSYPNIREATNVAWEIGGEGFETATLI